MQLTCAQCEPFPSRQFIAEEDTTFVAVIGPAANPRGYTAITGELVIIKQVGARLGIVLISVTKSYQAPMRKSMHHNLVL